MLTRLQILCLDFQFATSCALRDRKYRTVQILTQTVIPTLTSFEFDGPCNYVEDLVARFNT